MWLGCRISIYLLQIFFLFSFFPFIFGGGRGRGRQLPLQFTSLFLCSLQSQSDLCTFGLPRRHAFDHDLFCRQSRVKNSRSSQSADDLASNLQNRYVASYQNSNTTDTCRSSKVYLWDFEVHSSISLVYLFSIYHHRYLLVASMLSSEGVTWCQGRIGPARWEVPKWSGQLIYKGRISLIINYGIFLFLISHSAIEKGILPRGYCFCCRLCMLGEYCLVSLSESCTNHHGASTRFCSSRFHPHSVFDFCGWIEHQSCARLAFQDSGDERQCCSVCKQRYV